MIESIIERYSHLPAQRSAQWYLNRQISIGGSELATLLGLNKYKSIRELISEKVYNNADNTSVNFKWGNLFEDVHKYILETKLNVKIYDIGSIPWIDDTSGYRTSPDGIFSARIIDLKDKLPPDQYDVLLASNIDIEAETIFVVEMKAPAMRSLKGNVPEHYLPQVKSEMCIVPEVQFALFSECIFKRCAMRQFYMTSSEHSKTVSDSFTTMAKTLPIMRGIIYVYINQNTPKEIYTYLLNCTLKKYDGIIDMGDIDVDAFYHIVDYILDGELSIRYEIDGYRPEHNEDVQTLIGVIPWKVFDISYHILPKEPNYISNNWPIIEKTINHLRTIKEIYLTDPDSCEQHINDAVIDIEKLINN